MIKKIGTSSAFYGGGISTQKKLFIVPFGPYQGRAIALFQKTASQIVFVWADPPYTEWSSETEVVSDSADYPPSAHMDEAGNVYMAYTVVDTLDLAELKLTFSDGNWSIGTKNTVYNGDSNYFPSILKDKFDRLWVSWSRVSGADWHVNSKRSSDDGSTWGGGPSDDGTTLTSGSSSCFSQIVYRPDHVYVIYTEDGTKLAYRRMSTSGAIFEDEVTLYLGTDLGSGFSGASSDDLRLGVAFRDGAQIYYKEYDGAQWSGLMTVDDSASVPPNLFFRQSIPYVIFAREAGDNQYLPYCSFRESDSFSPPVPVSSEMNLFEGVLCYRPSAAVNFEDRTTEAGDESVADVHHSESGSLLLSIGDGIYMGQSTRFTMARINLSTDGLGGEVSWHYWNGSDWQAFTPSSGAYHFDDSPTTLRFWDDSATVPVDWQTRVINGKALYWIKAVAIIDYSPGPVGSQITGVADISHLIAG